jgi:hypothetical protein
MLMKKYTMLITGTIKPDSNVPFLQLQDKDERLKQYLWALNYLLRKGRNINVVFCDNSGQKCPDEIIQLAEKNKVKFEWLTFEGDTEKVVKYGKGFGEIEIINYALENSELIRECNYFIKLTGRIIVRNINMVLNSMNQKTNWFLTYGEKKVEKLDTRFYGIKKQTWKDSLSDIYTQGNDVINSVEILFARELLNRNEEMSTIRIQPNFEGESGGYGAYYYTSTIDVIKKTAKRLLATRNEKLFLEKNILWQGDLLLPSNVWEDVFGVLSKKRIIICGVNIVGHRFYYFAKTKCKIVGWTDKKFKGNSINGIKIKDIGEIKNHKVDYALIAAMNEESISEITRKLEQEGISNSNIISIKHVMEEKGYGYYLI